ncbi:hypothetical protein DRH27_02380 [Candidatus Falkowbacteria bacterium]|nr:MAG: hypothetical protein DRH27_02380 [Candidatus Falkowbacteria bacterium]
MKSILAIALISSAVVAGCEPKDADAQDVDRLVVASGFIGDQAIRIEIPIRAIEFDSFDLLNFDNDRRQGCRDQGCRGRGRRGRGRRFDRNGILANVGNRPLGDRKIEIEIDIDDDRDFGIVDLLRLRRDCGRRGACR